MADKRFRYAAMVLEANDGDAHIDDMITPCGLEFSLAPALDPDGSVVFVERWRRHYAFWHAISAGIFMIAVGFVICAIIDRDPSFAFYAVPLIVLGLVVSLLAWAKGRISRTARVTERQVEWTIGEECKSEEAAALYRCDLRLRNYHTAVPLWLSGAAVILATPNECMTVFLSTRPNSRELADRYVDALPTSVRRHLVDAVRLVQCWSVRRSY